jgi:hypothetical protein
MIQTPEQQHAPLDLSFEGAATPVLAELQTSVLGLIAALPGSIRSAADLQRALDIDSKLASQTIKVAFAPAPMAAGVVVPPRTSIGRLLAAAQTRGVTPTTADRVREAYKRFEGLVSGHAGDRARFEMMIADWAPADRERLDAESREAMVRARTQLRGVMVETSMMAFIIHPSKDGAWLDNARLSADMGLVRLRRGAKVVSSFRNFGGEQPRRTNLNNQIVEGPSGVVLEEFSSPSTPSFSAHGVGDTLYYTLDAEDVGLRTAADLVTADVLRNYGSRYADPKGRKVGGAFCIPDLPLQRQFFDILVPEGTFATSEPRVSVYETAVRGLVGRFDDPERELDRVDYAPPVRSMGRGIERFHAPGVRRYTEMLAHVCERLGWDGSRFVCHRCELEFPVHSWQVVMGFDLLKQR